MKIENITACVFDAYGTLFDVNSAAAKCKKNLVIDGKALLMLGEQLSLNIPGYEVL